MYCPKCSQQQVSEEMRFCSRCGFPLEGVKELVASGGALVKPAVETPVDQSKAFCKVRKAVWLMLAALPLLVFVGILSSRNDAFAVLALLPIFCFLFGFGRLIYISFKEGRTPLQQASATATLPQQATGVRKSELPPASVVPIENFMGQRIETAEMVRPPSVTENTTRLLDEETSRG